VQGKGGVFIQGGQGIANDVAVPPDVAPFGIVRDGLWPRSVISWLVLSAIFLVLSVQFVSPTRRWRLPGRRARKEPPA
jgi:hypothetical protein